MRLTFAGIVLLAAVGFCQADEVTITILKVEGKTITARSLVKKGETTSAELTFFIRQDDVKVVSARFNKDTKKIEAGEPVPEGIKNDMFLKGPVRARVVVDANKMIREIRVLTLKKKA